jgi:hypothetical protein
MASWHDIHTEFHDDRLRHLTNNKVITATISQDSMLVLLMGEIHEVCLSGFMKTGTGVQAILRFYLGSLRGCNFGIIDDKDLRSTPMSCAWVP